jgi:HK97 family phage portal protein
MATVRLQLFGRSLELTAKQLTAPYSPGAVTGGGWYPLVVREPYPGAWQVNVEARRDQVLQYAPVFSCVTLIAQDIGKLTLRLVEENDDDLWEETSSAAFSPVLRKPNRYQTTTKFVEQWITSKLMWGNAYVLKERDNRGVVVALYVLDPMRVTPLVAPDGQVYYQLQRDTMAGTLTLAGDQHTFIVPASEIIHDRMVCLFHPLVGMSPIYACATAALQGLAIQNTSSAFFTNGSRPSGLITAPAGMTPDQLAQAKSDWETFNGPGNAGKVAVITADIKYTQLSMNAVDAQLIQQLGWTAATICSVYHVPPFLIGVGEIPRGVQLESLWQMYHSLCIQSLLTNFETVLDEGLGIDTPINGTQYGTEFDINDLIWMDTATKTKAAADAIGAGAMSPDEARERYFGLGPVEGGDTPYMQQQMFSLKALAQRDSQDPFAKPTPAPMTTPAAQVGQVPEADAVKTVIDQLGHAIRRRAIERGLRAA